MDLAIINPLSILTGNSHIRSSSKFHIRELLPVKFILDNTVIPVLFKINLTYLCMLTVKKIIEVTEHVFFIL